MKLLVQSDDYGITPGAAAGIVYGIRNGIIRNTGMFMNMPWREEAAEMIRPYLDRIALGVDLNASTGSSLLGHEAVPELTHEDGSFLTSSENRALDTDENDHDHVNYDQIMLEFDAQIQEFVRLFGRLPDYLHRHAYETKTTGKAIADLAKKYGLIDSARVISGGIVKLPASMSWVRLGSADEQLKSDLKTFILEDRGELLGSDLAMLVAHCGFADMRS